MTRENLEHVQQTLTPKDAEMLTSSVGRIDRKQLTIFQLIANNKLQLVINCEFMIEFAACWKSIIRITVEWSEQNSREIESDIIHLTSSPRTTTTTGAAPASDGQ